MTISDDTKLFLKSLPNSYGQVFFSDNRVFSLVLFVVTFIDLNAGMMGLLSVLTTSITGFVLGFDRRAISRGLFGFNSLLVGLALGVYFQPGLLLAFIVVIGSILTLMVSVSMQGVIGKYALPYLSIPFLIGVWTMTLATREFTALGVSERGIFTFNDLYMIGGTTLVSVYEWWNGLELHTSIRTYLISLGAILFQYNILSGILLAAGLLYFSRISFTLSLLGFYSAFFFYEIIGADLSELSYSYIGFNYILTSIAVGGFFIIPSTRSYIWTVLLIPMVALVTISLSKIFTTLGLPIYSLPFNIVVLLFLYALKFRVRPSTSLSEVYIQQNSPEKNLYSFYNSITRFHHEDKVRLKLPFMGIWTVSQGHEGEFTHKDDYRFAWDFIITDLDGNQYSGTGERVQDYHCYDKQVLAPADGTIEQVVDHITDNPVGDANLRENWGNTVIIRHEDFLFSSLSHLKEGSVPVKEGERVKAGDLIGRCGNSGRSPYPHLHFQLQSTPFLGSTTLEYPLAYYILNSSDPRQLCSFEVPRKDQMVSNIESNELVSSALHLVPGKQLRWEITGMDQQKDEIQWDVETDSLNNTYIKCLQTQAVAWFRTDGEMIYFTHYQGTKKALLYYFFLAVFKLQAGYYQGMVLEDRYPLNLLFRFPLLTLQDIVAPFFTFLQARYRVRYASVDNEISPSEVILESSASTYLLGRPFRQINFRLSLGSEGFRKLDVEAGKLNIIAECIY